MRNFTGRMKNKRATNRFFKSKSLLFLPAIFMLLYSNTLFAEDFLADHSNSNLYEKITNINKVSDSPLITDIFNTSEALFANELISPYVLLEIKADKNTYSFVGEIITFKLIPTNISNVTVNDLSLLLPFSATNWNIGTLSAGEKDSTTFTYTIIQEDIDNGSLTVSTTVTGVSVGGLNVYAIGEITLDAENRKSSFNINKTALQTEYSSLETIQYRFEITNSGNTSLTQVFLTDDVLNITKALPNMAPADIYIDTIPYTVTQEDLDNGSITNIAEVVGRVGNNGLIVTDSDTVTINAIRGPQIELEKTPDDDTYDKETQTITYTFTVKNSGNVTLYNVTLVDSLTSTNYNLGSILPNKEHNYYANYEISQSDLDEGSITNIATVEASTFLGVPVSDSDTVTITAVQDASLSVKKEVEESFYEFAGDTLHYSIIIKNRGNVTLTNVQVDDPLTGIDTTLSVLIPGKRDTITGMYIILQPDVDAGSITNTATVSALDPNSQVLNETAQATINAFRFPFLDLTKTSDALNYKSVGDVVQYQIVVENTGNVTIYNAETTDSLAGLSDIITELSPGQLKLYHFPYTVTQADIDSGKIVNTAVVQGTEAHGTHARASDSWTIYGLQAPLIEISKNVLPHIVSSAGDTVMYYFEISNSGNVSLANVQLDDPKIPYSNSIPVLLPGEVWLDSTKYIITQADIDELHILNTATVSASTPLGDTISESDGAKITVTNVGAIEVVKTSITNSYSQPGQLLDFEIEVTNIGDVDLTSVVLTDSLTGETWNIGDMLVGASQLFSNQYTVSQANIDEGIVINTASVTGVENAATARPVASEDYAEVKAFRKGGIELEKSASVDYYYYAGEQIDYTLQLTNTGNVTLHDIVLTDTLTGLDQTIDTIAPGEVQNITTDYSITQADMDRGSLVNTATTSAFTSRDLILTDESSERLYAYQTPVISVSKIADREFYTAVDEIVNYTIIIENSGDVTLTDVQVNDSLIGFSENIPSMAPGTILSFTKKYSTTQTDLDAGELTNLVFVTATAPSKNIVYDGADLTLYGKQSPAITISKTSDDISYNSVGDSLSFALTVKNTGNVSLTNVKVVDPLSGIIQYIGVLTPGSDSTLHTTYTIKQADLDAGQIMNIASVNGSDPGEDKVVDSDTLVIKAIQVPLVAVTKTSLESNYEFVGDWLDYILEVKNIGNVTLLNVTLTDPLTGLHITYPEIKPSASEISLRGYFVDQDDLDRGEIVNTALVTALSPNGESVTASDSVRVVALQAAAIALNEVARPNIAENLGDTVNYKFTIENAGNVTLSDIILNDAKIPYIQNIPRLVSGEIWSDSLDYFITQTDIDDLVVINEATVNANAPDSSSVTDNDRAFVAIKQNGAIEVEKNCLDLTYLAPGDPVKFDVSVTNIGNVTLKDVVINDSLPGQTWTIDSMLPGAVSQYLSTYFVTQADIDRGTVVNVARAEAREATPLNRLVTSQDSAVSTAVRAPALELLKTAAVNTYNSVGEIIPYTLEAKNIGNVTLSDITVTDSLTGTVQHFPTLDPLTSEIIEVNYSITREDLDRGTVINKATMTGGDELEPLSLTDSSSFTVYAIQEPQINLEKRADKTTYQTNGETITYTLLATNTGNVMLDNVTIIDPMTGLNQLIGSLPEGEKDSVTATYNITLADLDQGFVTNTANVTGLDPEDTVISDEDEETLTAIITPSLSIEKEALESKYEMVGDALNFKLTLENTGNITLAEVVLEDPLTGTTSDIGSLIPGQIYADTLLYNVTQTDIDNGSVTNIISATGKSPIDTEVYDTDTAIVNAVQNPSITLEKVAGRSDFSLIGDLIDYTITVQNTGNVTLDNIRLEDPLTGLSQVIDTLNPAQLETFSTSHTVIQADLDAGQVTNIASIIASDPAKLTVTDADTVTVYAMVDPSIALSSNVIVDCEIIHFAYIVSNTGNVMLNNVVLNDPLTGTNQNIGDMMPDETDTFRVDYLVTDNDYSNGQVSSNASVTGLDSGDNTITETYDTVIPVHRGRSTKTVTACDHYNWNGEDYYRSGTYTVTLADANGCDSIATLHLTINISSNSLLNITTCGSYTWTDGKTYTHSGTYTQKHINAAGCDSTAILKLEILDEYSSTEKVTACYSYTWTDGNTYTQSGIYSQNLSTIDGCDSILILDLTIFEDQYETEYRVSCGNYIGPDGNTYTQSGVYTIIVPGAGGCDKEITLHLTILGEETTIIDTTVCESFVTNAGRVITESGIYEEAFDENALCDCRIRYNVTVNNPVHTEEQVEACESFTWLDGNTYTESGNYTDSLVGANGCDSIYSLELTILEPSYSDIYIAECDIYTAPDGSTYEQSGHYFCTLQNAAGCDSIINIDLLILEQGDTTRVDTTVCDEFITINNTTINISGIYTEVVTTASGCTKTVTYNVTVNNSTENIISLTACDSLTWIDGKNYNESGIYSITLTGHEGCDSVITLDLTILQTSSDTTDVTTYDNFIWTDGNIYTSSGIYTQVLINAAGCDSVDILNLVVVPTGYCEPSLINPVADTAIYVEDTVPVTLVLKPEEIFDVCFNGEFEGVYFFTDQGEELPGWIKVTETDTAYLLEPDPNLWNIGCYNIVMEAVNQLGTARDTFSICVDSYSQYCPPQLVRPVPNYDITADRDTLNVELSLMDDYLFESCLHNNYSCMSILLDDGRILPEWITIIETDTAYFINGIPSILDTGCMNIVVQVNNTFGTASDTFQLCIEACLPVLVNPIADTTLSTNATEPQYIELSLLQNEIFLDCDTLPFTTYSLSQIDGNPLPEWINLTEGDSAIIIECQPAISDTGCINIVFGVANNYGIANDTFDICAKDIPVGINQSESNEFGVSLYPNPTKGEVVVEIDSPGSGNFEIIIRSVNGQEIFRKSYESTDRINFNLSQHVSGMYLVIVQNNEHIVVKKLILDRE